MIANEVWSSFSYCKMKQNGPDSRANSLLLLSMATDQTKNALSGQSFFNECGVGEALGTAQALTSIAVVV